MSGGRNPRRYQVTGHPATEKHNMDMHIAARIGAALADANILAVYHGYGVFCCGDNVADRYLGRGVVAYGEIMVIVGEDDIVSVATVWRDDEGDVVDNDDTGFQPDDLDGIVSAVSLRGGAA